MTERLMKIDMGTLQPDIPYDDAIELCAELGLFELMMHGSEEYGRLTQKGVNVLCAMIELAQLSNDPDAQMKVS